MNLPTNPENNLYVSNFSMPLISIHIAYVEHRWVYSVELEPQFPAVTVEWVLNKRDQRAQG